MPADGKIIFPSSQFEGAASGKGGLIAPTGGSIGLSILSDGGATKKLLGGGVFSFLGGGGGGSGGLLGNGTPIHPTLLTIIASVYVLIQGMKVETSINILVNAVPHLRLLPS